MIRWFLILCVLAGMAQAQMQVPQSRAEISMGFTPVVEKAAPAVVNIYARRVVNRRVSPFMGDPFFQELFRDFAVPRPQVENSLGSGVILSEEGIVVSNYHVVGGATDIRVVLSDKREYDARVLLADEESDLAVMQLEGAKDMPVLELRDSDTIGVGELVLAIGNPFGVGQTVTSGIVSGLARSGIATGNARGYYIQTDAPINPGNSGGALVDVNGRLIGINTSILSRSGGSIGIGFAIPADLVARFVAQAEAGHETFIRPWAGLGGQAVTADMIEGLGLKRPGGLIVTHLHPQSPFADGVETGDVITAVDGQPVNTAAEMIYRMSVEELGAEVSVTRVRGGEAEEVPVKLIEAPEEPARAPLETDRRAAIPGLSLININPAVIAEYELPLAAEGVLVAKPGRIGARLGLKAGDILRAVNGEAAENTEITAELLRNARGRLSIEMQRGDQRHELRFRL